MGEDRDNKKVRDISDLMSEANKLTNDLKTVIADMEEKRGRVFLKCLKDQIRYLDWEEGFNPKKRKNFERKEVVHVQFGFNTGSEHGGPHWAVILDGEKWSCPTVTVVPLGSLEEGETQEHVHKDDVFIGTIPSINEKLVYAIPNQIRTISKLRIIRPRHKNDKSIKLSNQQMDEIDKKLFQMFFSKSKVIHELVANLSEAATAREK